MKYLYASGAIKAKASKLFGRSEYERLLKADSNSYFEVLRNLGYGNDHVADFLDDLIQGEELKTKKDLMSILDDPKLIELWYLKYDLVNIKLILKKELFQIETARIFEECGTIKVSELTIALVSNNFIPVREDRKELLMNLAALKNAGLDAKRLSVRVDNLVYMHIIDELEKLGDKPFLTYFKTYLDLKNLVSLFRANKLGLSYVEANLMLVDGGNIPLYKFEQMAKAGIKNQMKRLKTLFSKDAINAVLKYFGDGNLTSLELNLRKSLLSLIKEYDYDTFSSGPLINFLVKKDFEIQNIRRLYFDKSVAVSDLIGV